MTQKHCTIGSTDFVQPKQQIWSRLAGKATGGKRGPIQHPVPGRQLALVRGASARVGCVASGIACKHACSASVVAQHGGLQA